MSSTLVRNFTTPVQFLENFVDSDVIKSCRFSVAIVSKIFNTGCLEINLDFSLSYSGTNCSSSEVLGFEDQFIESYSVSFDQSRGISFAPVRPRYELLTLWKLN